MKIAYKQKIFLDPSRQCFILHPEDGECYTFGSNQFGQLGVNKSVSARDTGPRTVDVLKEHAVSMVGCGDTFTVAVTQGEWGQLVTL